MQKFSHKLVLSFLKPSFFRYYLEVLCFLKLLFGTQSKQLNSFQKLEKLPKKWSFDDLQLTVIFNFNLQNELYFRTLIVLNERFHGLA